MQPRIHRDHCEGGILHGYLSGFCRTFLERLDRVCEFKALGRCASSSHNSARKVCDIAVGIYYDESAYPQSALALH